MKKELKLYGIILSLLIAIGILSFLDKNSPLVCGDISNQYIYSPQKEGILFGEKDMKKKVYGRKGHKENCLCCICKAVRGETKGISKSIKQIQNMRKAKNSGRWKKGDIPWNKKTNIEITKWFNDLFYIK